MKEHKWGTKIITICALLIMLLLFVMIVKYPRKIHKLETDTIYIATEKVYHEKVSRYYLELKSDGTYILMFDGTLATEEDYSPEAGNPFIKYRKGTYEKKGTDYILHATEGGGVGFRDLEAVKRKEIFAKGTMTKEEVEADYSYNPRALWKTTDNEYRLGYLLENGSYAEDTDVKRYLYTSDRKDIPDSREELFDEYELVEE